MRYKEWVPSFRMAWRKSACSCGKWLSCSGVLVIGDIKWAECEITAPVRRPPRWLPPRCEVALAAVFSATPTACLQCTGRGSLRRAKSLQACIAVSDKHSNLRGRHCVSHATALAKRRGCLIRLDFYVDTSRGMGRGRHLTLQVTFSLYTYILS